LSREVISTPNAPGGAASIGTFPYSQAIRAAGLIWVAGQGPFDPVSGAVVGSTIQEQTRQCLANIAAILEAAGSSMHQVVNATFILRHAEDFAGMNEEWVRWFPADPPARQGAKHPLEVGNVLISIAAVAAA
jgi:2-iminobutanoate/2-iminopropanoate deaminase